MQNKAKKSNQGANFGFKWPKKKKSFRPKVEQA